MLAAIRKYSNSPIAKTLLFILVIAFIASFGLFQLVRKVFGKDYVLKLGSRRISPEVFLHEKRRINSIQKGFSKDHDKALDANFVLQRIICDNIIDLATEDFGFIISETTIKRYIGGLYMFRDKRGVFNANLFRIFLRKIQISENAFMGFLENEIKTSLIKLPFSYISVINELYPYTCAQLEHRTLTVVEVDPPSFSISQVPTDAELEEFYNAHKNEFMLGETRSFTLLELKESSVKDKIEIPEQEVKDLYETSPLKETKSYDEAKTELTEELKQEKLSATINDVTRQIEDDLMSGVSQSEVIKKFNLSVTKIENVVSNTAANDQSKFGGISYKEDALAVAFSMDDGTDSSFSEALNANGEKVQWMERLNGIVPTHVEPFASAKEKVMALWVKQKQQEKATEFAVELQKSASLTSLERTAQQTGCYVTPKFDRNGDRTKEDKQKYKDDNKNSAKNAEKNEANDKNKNEQDNEQENNEIKDKFTDIINALHTDAFEMQSSDVRYKKIGDKIAVYQISEIIPAMNISDEENKKYQTQLTRELVDDLQQQLINYLSRNDHAIKINDDMLRDIQKDNDGENAPQIPMGDIF
jgi:hypothetical protein